MIKIITVINAIWTFIKNLFGSKKEIHVHENGAKAYIKLDRKMRRDLADLIENLDGVAVDHTDINNVMSTVEYGWWINRGIKEGKKIDQSLRNPMIFYKITSCN
jgi:hypothetical protein